VNLLTRSGVVFMAFQPSLSAEQYAMLLEISQQAETANDLRNKVAAWAKSENLTVRFEE
jgi:hypothetical protein